MADAFWDPIFARLIDDPDCVRMMAENLTDRLLLEPVRGNPALWKQIQPFCKGDRFLNRARGVEIILRSAADEQPLRRILLWSWVQANDQVLRFATLPIDRDSEKRLLQGEFGSQAKLAILARIDPRESAKPVYEKVLNRLRAEAGPTASGVSVTPGGFPGEAVAGGGSERGPDGLAAGFAPTAKGVESVSQADVSPALKRELEQTRAELRDLRRNLKTLEEERRQWERRFLDGAQERDDLKKKLADLELVLKRDRSRLDSLEKERMASDAECAARLPSKKASDTGVEPASASCGETPEQLPHRESVEQKRRIHDLEEVVERRDRALERQELHLVALRGELEEERQARRSEDRRTADQGETSRRLQALEQAKLACLYHRWQEGDHGAPHLVWEIVGEGFEIVPCTARECEERTEGELALLVPAGEAGGPEKNHPSFRLHPLEKPLAESIVGYYSSTPAGPILCSADGDFPIHAPLPPVTPGSPLAGRLMASFGDRPEGIRAVRCLKTNAEKAPETFMSFENLAHFFHLEKRPSELLREHLKRLGEPWHISEAGVDFGVEARLVLPGLRLRLPISRFCERPECFRAREKQDLVRVARPGELCGWCHEDAGPAEGSPGETWNFKGARVLLIGGDEVGPAYRTASVRHQLEISWLSGFGHIDSQTQRLKDYDLVAVVVRQVSHTLVRELTAAARRQSTRLAFLTRRGVTGVIRELAGLLKAAREK